MPVFILKFFARLVGQRFAKAAAWASVAALAIIAFLIFRFVWLPSHDRAVRAEYLVELTAQAHIESDKAGARADKAAEASKEQTDEVQNSIANSSGVDELFSRLRAQGGTK